MASVEFQGREILVAHMYEPSPMIGLVILAALVLALAWAAWWAQRRTAHRAGLAERGLQLRRQADETLVTPTTGDWTIAVTRSFAAQMSPPSSHIVVSIWRSATPSIAGAALVAGPAPTPGLRDMAVALLGSATPAMNQWLGIDRISGGRPLSALTSVDDRLLAFATDGYRPSGDLAAIADAISGWCSRYNSEREQPAVVVDDSGLCVRVRADVLRSLDQIDAFVELGLRCRDGFDR